MQDYRQLKVWQKSHSLVLRIYTATATFPEPERYGLTSQMRRAAASIAANIAEGCGRVGRAELRQFLYTSFGLPANLSTSCCLRGTCVSSLRGSRRLSTRLSVKSSACSPA